MQIEYLVRYPVKGLGPDFLFATDVKAGGAIPFDREYALALAETRFDPGRPAYLKKRSFFMLMCHPMLAALRTTFNESRRSVDTEFPDGIKVSCRLDHAEDHGALVNALSEFLGTACRGGPPRIVSARNHHFFDMPRNYLSLINLASVVDLGRAIGAELEPIRFRANVYVTGMAPWVEKDLVGKVLTCGDVRFRAVQAIRRCAATSANPDTGEVDVNVPLSLRKEFDTLDMGVYLEVLRGGRLKAGGTIALEN